MNTADKAIITVNIDRQRLETLKDAFSGTSYAKISLDVVKNTMKITCPLKKKVAAHRTIIQLDKESINGVPVDSNGSWNEVVMRLAYPSDVVSCMRIPEGTDHITIAFAIRSYADDEVNAVRMEVRDPMAGTFKFEALSPNAASIWNEVKDAVLNQPPVYSFNMTQDAMWTIGTLNKMSRSIDAYILLAQPGKPVEIRVYNSLDDSTREMLSNAVASKVISDIDKVETINTMLLDAASFKGGESIISIVAPEAIAILPFNKPVGSFHVNQSLIYYDIDNERYVLPVKRQL